MKNLFMLALALVMTCTFAFAQSPYSKGESVGKEIAKSAIAEMHRQHPLPVIEDGLIKSGVVVRVLLLPMHVAEAKLAVKYLYEKYGDSIYISLMNQYTPMPGLISPLDRAVTNAEYDELVEYAMRIGVRNAFIQEGGTQSESFIPDFDGTGVAP